MPVTLALLGMGVGGSIAGSLWQSELQVQWDNRSQRNKVEGRGGVTEYTNVILRWTLVCVQTHTCAYVLHIHALLTPNTQRQQISK